MLLCLESNAETEKERGRRRGRGERIPPQLQGDEEVKPAPLYSSLSRLELISPALLPPGAPVLPLRSGGTLIRHGRIQTLASSSHFFFTPSSASPRRAAIEKLRHQRRSAWRFNLAPLFVHFFKWRGDYWFCCFPRLMVCSCVGNAMATPSAQQQHQDYFRSVSSESTSYMMVPAGGPSGLRRREAPSKMWVAMVVIVVVVLQIASTTGLFLYLNMSISQVRSASQSLHGDVFRANFAPTARKVALARVCQHEFQLAAGCHKHILIVGVLLENLRKIGKSSAERLLQCYSK